MVTLPANGTYSVYYRRCPAEGRAGVRLPAAHRRAAARFRTARDALGRQCRGERQRSAHGARAAQGWIRRRHRARASKTHRAGSHWRARRSRRDVDQVRITLASSQLQREPLKLVLEGRATVEGNEVTRQAVPAEDMMQAFFYRHLVPESELKLVVRRGAQLRAPARIAGARVWKYPPAARSACVWRRCSRRRAPSKMCTTS